MKKLFVLTLCVLLSGCAGVREKVRAPKPQITHDPSEFRDFPPVEEEYPVPGEYDPSKDPYYNNISILSAEERGVYIR